MRSLNKTIQGNTGIGDPSDLLAGVQTIIDYLMESPMSVTVFVTGIALAFALMVLADGVA